MREARSHNQGEHEDEVEDKDKEIPVVVAFLLQVSSVNAKMIR